MIDADAARASAARELENGPQNDDEQFSAWRGATAGEPQLVYDEFGKPGYWLVPIENQGRSVGAVRVLGSGRVAALIAYRAGSNLLELTRAQVLEQAASEVADDGSEQIGNVLLIHDGPPGREAWRVEVIVAGNLQRWIFVTPGGIYQRTPGGERLATNQ
jgi:hypothetical protein